MKSSVILKGGPYNGNSYHVDVTQDKIVIPSITGGERMDWTYLRFDEHTFEWHLVID